MMFVKRFEGIGDIMDGQVGKALDGGIEVEVRHPRLIPSNANML